MLFLQYPFGYTGQPYSIWELTTPEQEYQAEKLFGTILEAGLYMYFDVLTKLQLIVNSTFRLDFSLIVLPTFLLFCTYFSPLPHPISFIEVYLKIRRRGKQRGKIMAWESFRPRLNL